MVLVAGCPPLARAQAPTLSGIAHAAFRVSDVEKSREFYQKLGFKQAFEFGDAGKTSVSYIKINDRQFVELYQRRNDAQPLGLLHVCFESSDLNALHEAYVARGLSLSTVKKAHAGNLLSVLRDPEGQVVEFTQYLPGSLHSKQKGKLLGAHRISDRILRVKELVENISQARNFYESKLGFAAWTQGSDVVLSLPSSSGEQIELVPSDPGQKPGLTFSVKSVPKAIKELRARGIAIQEDAGAARTSDPDGNVIIFVVLHSRRNGDSARLSSSVN